MNFQEAVNNALSDFEDFYFPGQEPQIKSDFTMPGNYTAKAIGSQNNRAIAFRPDLANHQIVSLADLMFMLLILGHEIAHCVNDHNTVRNEPDEESVAFETWADFFGARVMFTLITYGTRTRELLNRLQAVPFVDANKMTSAEWQESILRACGQALDRAYQSIYAPSDCSKRYPKAPVRVLTFIAGVSSFFFRLFDELNESWTIYVYKKVLFSNSWSSEVGYHSSANIDSTKPFDTISKLHLQIKGERRSICSGVKPRYSNLIGTSYLKESERRNERKKQMEEMFSNWSESIRKQL